MLVRVSCDGQTLGDALRLSGVAFGMPCGGHGRCGKCGVQARGELAPPSAEEQQKLIGMPPPMDGFVWRMACLCGLLGTAEVLLPTESATSVLPYPLPASQRPGFHAAEPGIAVDIGTTTIAMQLYSPGSAPMNELHEMNRQSIYGADVLSRIDHAAAHGVEPQRLCLENQLSRMMEQLRTQAGMPLHAIRSMVITGNTTMLHILTGLNPQSLGVSPFTPVSVFGCSQELFGIPAYLPRCISAYVGADITCGILATRLCEPGRNHLLVDIGTNGEMALFARERLFCCATAAGPAFEGAQISMGMPALAGALDQVDFHADRWEYHVLGETKPIGLCGSGLVDALCALRQAGVLEASGRLAASPYLLGDSGVSITQADVRNVQLAKAAIAAGIDTLLHEAHLLAEDVDALFLCGGFGSYLKPKKASEIGLIPEALVHCTVAAGNTALRGAADMLFSPPLRALSQELIQGAQEVPLATHPYFMERYIDHMSLGAQED